MGFSVYVNFTELTRLFHLNIAQFYQLQNRKKCHNGFKLGTDYFKDFREVHRGFP